MHKNLDEIICHEVLSNLPANEFIFLPKVAKAHCFLKKLT